MTKIHTINLSVSEKEAVMQTIKKGKANPRVINRCHILRLADKGKADVEIAQILSISPKTPYEIRKRYHQGGLTRALYDLPRPGQPRKLNGIQEARVVAIACTDPPKGYNHWTMDLLTEEAKKQLGVTIGRTAIWKVTLRNPIKPWLKKNVVHSHTDKRVYQENV